MVIIRARHRANVVVDVVLDATSGAFSNAGSTENDYRHLFVPLKPKEGLNGAPEVLLEG
jgi:hypothetical protein